MTDTYKETMELLRMAHQRAGKLVDKRLARAIEGNLDFAGELYAEALVNTHTDAPEVA